jgi:hypothetical protein
MIGSIRGAVGRDLRSSLLGDSAAVGLPEPGAAIWHLPEGPFTFVEGGVVPATLEYNVS